METLTGRERIGRILRREPVDRVGVWESFWPDTHAKWAAAGRLGAKEDIGDHFGHDLRTMWPFNYVADLDFGEQIIEETDETKLVRNGNGSLLRWWKNKSGTPEHVDFLVTDRAAWDQKIRHHLINPDSLRRRINFEGYRKQKVNCDQNNLFFCAAVINVFELMHPVCGHEHMLMGMALDPDWVKDMCTVYAELAINLMETLFDAEGAPDAVFFYEDMGFKERPFMSPAMYKEIVWPAHKRTFDYVHSKGSKVIMHSCGYVEPLVPALIEAGLDCLQAMEVKAGMDLPTLKARFGDQISLFGGMDVRALESNDLDQVKAELDKKLPPAMGGGGYILHSDHSISDRVDYDTYKYFLDYGLQLGTY